MDVEYDALGGDTTLVTTTTKTWSHTCTGTERALVVGGLTNGTLTATYAGVSMTQVQVATSPGGINSYLFVLANPASGANNVILTRSGGTFIVGGSASFTNVDQSTPVDVSVSETNTTSTTVLTTLTTLTDGAWTVANWREDVGRALTPDSGTTEIFDGGGLGWHFVRSTNAITTAGSTSLGGSISTATTWGETMLALRPVGGGGTVLPSYIPMIGL